MAAGKPESLKNQAPFVWRSRPSATRSLERRLQPRAEELPVVGHQRAFVGGGGQVAGVDEGVGEVDGGRLHLSPQELVGVLDEELLQGVVAGDEDPQALALAPAGPAPLLPEAGHGPRVAHGDGGVEGADVDAQLERAGADHGQELAAEQHALDAPALLGRVAGAIGRQLLGQTGVGLLEPVDRLLVDELGAAAGLGEADGADPVTDEFAQQFGGLAVGAAPEIQLFLHQGRLPEHDLAGARPARRRR